MEGKNVKRENRQNGVLLSARWSDYGGERGEINAAAVSVLVNGNV